MTTFGKRLEFEGCTNTSIVNLSTRDHGSALERGREIWREGDREEKDNELSFECEFRTPVRQEVISGYRFIGSVAKG